MDLTFDIKNHEGNHIMVALSYYDTENVCMLTDDNSPISLVFYDVTLVRKSGHGYVGTKMLYAISDTLAKFMYENSDAVLCFYCDSNSDIHRNHRDLLPQEYRSRLFSKMFDWYTKSNDMSGFINQRIEIDDIDDRTKRQYAHFICRQQQLDAVNTIGRKLMEK